jgi:predicted metal-binding protein
MAARHSAAMEKGCPMPTASIPSQPCLHVCTTCRSGEALVEGQDVPGRRMFDAVQAVIDRDASGVTLLPVVCLGNCAQGCSAAVTQDGKWSYLLGHMRPEQAADLVGYAVAYGASENGTVWRSGRAASLRDAMVARIPGHGFTQKETA